MKYLSLVCKGFIIGIAKIIPGVSGAIIAISFGLYERLVSIMSKPTKIRGDDVKFLIFLLIGAALGIGLLCKSVKWCLDVFYFPTILLFTGLIIGGIPEITNEIKKSCLKLSNGIVFAFCFGLIYFLIHLNVVSNINVESDFVYFLIGVIESLTTIIPGISGTAIFMALGWYEKLLTFYESVASFNSNFMIVLLFFCGFIVSTILISKIITWLFINKKSLAYTGVLGFMCGSLLIMLEDAFSNNFSIINFIIGIILLFVGIWLTKKINSFFSKL